MVKTWFAFELYIELSWEFPSGREKMPRGTIPK